MAHLLPIISDIKSFGWAIWQPVLFVIPKAAVMPASRIFPMPAKYRAAYGPEFQIRDLDASEFEVIGR